MGDLDLIFKDTKVKLLVDVLANIEDPHGLSNLSACSTTINALVCSEVVDLDPGT